MRLRTLLSKINPKSVLALTATAGPPVIKDICHTLHIRNPNREGENVIEAGTKVLSCNRDNIDVEIEFVNSDEDKLSKVSTMFVFISSPRAPLKSPTLLILSSC